MSEVHSRIYAPARRLILRPILVSSVSVCSVGSSLPFVNTKNTERVFMFLLRFRAGRFVLCGPGFGCLFYLGWGGSTVTTTVVDEIVTTFSFVSPFPCVPFCHLLGEENKKGGGLPGTYS